MQRSYKGNVNFLQTQIPKEHSHGGARQRIVAGSRAKKQGINSVREKKRICRRWGTKAVMQGLLRWIGPMGDSLWVGENRGKKKAAITGKRLAITFRNRLQSNIPN